MKLNIIVVTFALFIYNISVVTATEINPKLAIQQFKTEMIKKHGFDQDYLDTIFSRIKLRDSIIKAISRPAEGKPWHQYRAIFLTESRIQGGVDFWNKHENTIAAVAEKYGVPAEIMIAILGVETRYGANTGSYPVLDAISTLAFLYPKRSSFFRSELEQFLLLVREEGVDPLSLTGSYAGAMGLPQFMPSSYRHYAVDFDNDKQRDIWKNPADTLASIANYFVKHGWQPGQPVAFKITAAEFDPKPFLNDDLQPAVEFKQLIKAGITTDESIRPDEHVKLLQYELINGYEYWLGLKNFYVITRYNHSQLYAMAVFQLSQEIKNRKQRLKKG
ncbi:MAG TPA: lytic murein transglycosylase B [Crenotrichaceae bacterium]|nr:lytic murein transglycosylase B [Crenotrichaceae bacterium]